MGLSIDVLGTPRVEVDGAPLDVDTRKATALLAYLAVSGGVHGRELLVDLLWPGADRDRGMAALRRTLSTLRSALGQRWLRVERAVVSLDVDDGMVDVRRFRALVASAGDGQDGVERLTAAVALHRGDLLAGFGLRDSVEFDDWQSASTGALRAELELALDRLVAGLAALGRLDEAIVHARRRLELDPLHEPAHRALIGLYAVSGHRAEALHQYRECVRVLDRELGVRPLAETTALYDAVNEGLSPAWPERAQSIPTPRPEPSRPLVGRDAERRRLADAYGAIGEDGLLLVIEGEAGIGKTRLAEDFADLARQRGARVAAARGHEGEAGLPFGLVAAALRAALEAGTAARLADVPRHWRAEAGRLVPEVSADEPPSAATDGLAAEQRLHEALVQVFGGLLAGEAPGVLFLDDLQHADPASLGFVGYLGRRLTMRPIVVVVAWRGEDVGPEQGRLRRLAGRAVRLGRLSQADVARLADEAGAGEHAPLLFAQTQGLPLFVVEYLAALRTAGQPAAEMPLGVRELLASRIDQAGEAAAQLLAAAAVIGRSFDVETLRSASGRGEEETVAGLEELTHRGLIVERADGYDFAHDRLLDLVSERTSLARKRLLHRRVAEALVAGRGDAALIARHQLSAGLEAEAAVSYRAAADRAMALFAYSEALEGFRTALALGHPDQAGLHEAIGDVHTLRGEYRQAIAAYEAAAALADPVQVAGIEHKLGRVHDRRGDAELAERHLAAAIDLGGENARLQADRSLVAHRRGLDAEAVELAERALELSVETDEVARAHNILGMLTGEPRHLERSVELAETLPDRSVLVAALNNLALVLARNGETEQALPLTERALSLCVEQGDRHREAALRGNLADLLHRAGREAEAMVQLKAAATIFAEVGSDEDGMQPGVWKLVEW